MAQEVKYLSYDGLSHFKNKLDNIYTPKQANTKFYPYIGTSNSSKCYKITLPYNGITTSYKLYMMNTMEIVLGSSYQKGATGKIFLSYYFTKQADNTWSAQDIRAFAIGCNVSPTITYQISNPAIFWINLNSTTYNTISIVNLTAADSAPSYDYRNTIIESDTNAPTTNISTIPIAILDSDGSKLRYNGNEIAITNHTHTVANITDFGTHVYDATISRTKNTVLAAPNGSNGTASFRALVAADLPTHTHSYLPLTGGTMTGVINSQSIIPKTTNTYDLGSSSLKWSNVYATTFRGNLSGNVTGNLTGNATSATTASKLSNTTAIGSVSEPVYFTANGVPAVCSHAIKTVAIYDKDENRLKTAGWYRIATLKSYGSFLLSISGSYHNINSTAASFIINKSHDVANIQQLSPASVASMITKVRLVDGESRGIIYVEVYNNYTNETNGQPFVYRITTLIGVTTNGSDVTIQDPVAVTHSLTVKQELTIATSASGLIPAHTHAIADLPTHTYTSAQSLGWTSTIGSTKIPTINTIAYWNGAWDSNGSSNLAYCNKGAFGTIVTKNIGDYLLISGGTMTGVINSQSIIPKTTNTYDLGSSSLKWANVYATTLYENGTSLVNKYATKHTHTKLTDTEIDDMFKVEFGITF